MAFRQNHSKLLFFFPVSRFQLKMANKRVVGDMKQMNVVFCLNSSHQVCGAGVPPAAGARSGFYLREDRFCSAQYSRPPYLSNVGSVH